jgi:hypothetical protein
VDDPLIRLRDAVAIQDEHSHVGRTTREVIAEVILEAQELERVGETASRIVATLHNEALAEIVADWLEAQIAI